jgi:hypothetical protein
VYAAEKRTPRAAIESSAGVGISPFPSSLNPKSAQPASSDMISRMLGEAAEGRARHRAIATATAAQTTTYF